jgi:hypothetical protein
MIRMNSFTKLEKEILIELLEIAKEKISRHTNDYLLPNTAEGRNLAEAVINWCPDFTPEEKEEDLSRIEDSYENDKPYFGINFLIVAYLQEKLKEVL